MSRLRADLLLLITALVWGSAFVGQATAMAHVGPFTFTGGRFLLAALAVAPFALWESRSRARPLSRRNGLITAGIGLVFFLACITQQVGLQVTSVTNAGFLTALYVVLVPILGAALWRYKAPGIIWVAALLSFAGTFLLSGGNGAALNWGDAIMVVSALFWAAQVLLVGKYVEALERPFAIAFMQFLVTGLAGFGLGLAFEADRLSAAAFAGAGFEFLYTGILSGGLCFTLQSLAQRYTPPSDAAIIMSGEALFAALFGALLLGERLTPLAWSGAALILIAVLATQLGPALRRRDLRDAPAEAPGLEDRAS